VDNPPKRNYDKYNSINVLQYLYQKGDKVMVFLVLALIIAIFAVLFALQNTAPITISIFMWEIPGSLALVLLVALALGVVIAFLAYLPSLIRNKMNLSRQRKKIAVLEKSLVEKQATVEELQLKLNPPVVAPQPSIAASDSPTPPLSPYARSYGSFSPQTPLEASEPVDTSSDSSPTPSD
jgi:putative membrane protein